MTNKPQHDDELDDLLDGTRRHMLATPSCFVSQHANGHQDVLGDFNKMSTTNATNAAPTAGSSAEADLDADMAKELAKGMDELLKEMTAVDPKLKEEMEMLLSGPLPGVPSSTPLSGPKSQKSKIEEIQSKLRDSSEKVGVRIRAL